MTGLKVVALILVAIGAGLAFSLVTGIGAAQVYRIVGAEYREAEREIFEETKSFQHGTIRDLENLRLEYMRAGPEHRPVIRATILHRVSTFDRDELPPHLRAFVEELERDAVTTGGRLER